MGIDQRQVGLGTALVGSSPCEDVVQHLRRAADEEHCCYDEHQSSPDIMRDFPVGCHVDGTRK